MEYKQLGRSGLKVSRLCLGTMNFGPNTSEKEAHRIMDAALAAGINFFDTANAYGGGQEHRGLTEEIIGRWFAKGEARRERTVLATKVYGGMPDSHDGPNEAAGLSAYKIRRHLAASLRRLQTDRVELYQMHHIDESVTWDELWEVFQALLMQGQVAYIGSSNFAAWHLVQAQAASREKNMLGLISEQHIYNLITRQPELEVLPAARALGIGVMVYSPLAGGLLAGSIEGASEGTRRASKLSRNRFQKFADQIREYETICHDLGASPANVGLAWVLNNPAVTSVIIGPRTVDQFEDSLKSLQLILTDDALERLDGIFPGPGGPAPWAYAW